MYLGWSNEHSGILNYWDNITHTGKFTNEYRYQMSLNSLCNLRLFRNLSIYTIVVFGKQFCIFPLLFTFHKMYLLIRIIYCQLTKKRLLEKLLKIKLK